MTSVFQSGRVSTLVSLCMERYEGHCPDCWRQDLHLGLHRDTRLRSGLDDISQSGLGLRVVHRTGFRI